MTDLDTNTAPGLGHNAAPDHGAEVAERLNEEYREIDRSVEELLAEAEAAPKEVNDDATAGVLGKLVKRMRDTAAQLKTYHVSEKEPYFRAGQAVDRYFFARWEKLTRRNKTDKPGLADTLEMRIDAYNQRKLAEERRRREEEARIAREVEDKARREREAAERAAREAEERAARARNAEKIKEHEEEARKQREAAEAARAQETVAIDRRQETAQAATAKPADLVRARVADDVTVTMKREAYAEVIDVALLDKDTLWAFIDDEAKAKALRAWAKVTQYKRPMDGALIGYRDKTTVR